MSKKPATKTQIALRHYDTILRPIITEKATLLSEQGKVSFYVRTDATKPGIREAVEALFNVKVQAVNTVTGHGKVKRFRGRIGQQSDYKKAIITLAEGQRIDVMSGI